MMGTGLQSCILGVMKSRARSILMASLTMVGSIIGAGIFGLPSAFARVGFWQGSLLFWVLAFASTTTHLFLAGLLLNEHRRMRLTGLVDRHLDPFFHVVARITYPLQIVASLFAYVVLGGEFVDVLMRAVGIHAPVGFWQIFFWMVGGGTVLFGLKTVAKINSLATAAKMAALLLAVVIASPVIHFSGLSFQGSTEWYLPFGVFLYALSGLSVVGEAVEIAYRDKRSAGLAVVIGSLAAAFLSWLFGTSIYFAAHGYPIHTISDIVSVLPSGWVLLIPVLGLLAVLTAYVNLAQDFKETLDLDFKLNAMQAMAVTVALPFFMLVVFSRDFLGTIGFIGSVFVSINGLLVCAMAFKGFEKERSASSRVIHLFLTVLISGIFLFALFQRILFRESL